ncbi:hypothetical protein [Pseudomonas sp. XK-1]|uniref:hypothetical protein n=1 Tax=Pseudomonas sp. XK-1 TaxID=3136019 RepID=UPI0031195BE7
MRRLLKISITILLTSTSTVACSQEGSTLLNSGTNTAQGNGLCNSNEESIFTCLTEKKTASLCLRRHEGNIHIKYKYGTNRKIELSYPENEEGSTEKFKLSTTPYPGGGENRIRFTIGKHDYYLYDITKTESDESGQYPEFKSGLFVLKHNAKVFSQSCRNDASITAPAFEILKEEEFKHDLGINH